MSSSWRDHLRASLTRMLAFYGLGRRDGVVVKAAEWQERMLNWFVRPTHNNLRITRILKSLCALSLRVEAESLLVCLHELAGDPQCGVGETAYEFWDAAVPSRSRG